MSPAQEDKTPESNDDSIGRRLDAALPGPLSAPRDGRSQAASDPHRFFRGKVVDDFELVVLLGEGGMGQVWEARQLSLGGRRVALKFIHPNSVTDRYLEYFGREARAGGRLAHPGLVAVYAHSTTDGIAWIAMELVEGGRTLRDVLDRHRRLDELPASYDRDIATTVAQVAGAMQAVHDRGVVHRDLKPRNILIDPDGWPKVTDFGLARITDESALSQTGDIAGTYFYMSPEQVAAKRTDVDHRSDIFSLGIVMYEMLTLRRPFQGDTIHQVAQQIMLRDVPDMRVVRSRIPHDLAVICGKALEKSPARRYASMADFAADIGRHLANEPIRAVPPPWTSRLVKWTKRNPTKSAAAIVAVLAFVVISGLGLRLSKANAALEIKTDEARKNAIQAQNNADDAERKAADVMRLSLAQDYEDLTSTAAELWPAHQNRIGAYTAWISDARALTANLPALVEKRDELRALALPQSDELRQAERQSHPDFLALERAEGELALRRWALEQRRDGESAPLPDVDWRAMPADAAGLVAMARLLVAPGRSVFGQEPLGLVLAEHAIELASDGERSEVAGTLSQAYFALGRDEEALGLAMLSMEEARNDERAVRRLQVELVELERNVAEVNSKEAFAAEAKGVEQLAKRVSELERHVGARRSWTFSDEAESANRARWWHNQLSALIGELETLSTPGTGLLAVDAVNAELGWSILRRLAFARRLEEGFAAGGEFALRWEEALPQIREAYPGLTLGVQSGLVPIGPDSDSGLWEFWHVQTGEEPVRERSGELVMGTDSGLVFVLLPAARFLMGAQAGNSNGPNFDRQAAANESPLHEVDLSAFFLSKYEMTQGQWERITGANPSRWTASTFAGWIEGAHPVEQVSWHDCMALLPTLGFTLPSEAQWEYGCRAGGATPRPFAFERFATHANIADLSHDRAFTVGLANESWDDGMAVHAPVGRMRPNGFGLHDMIGNLWEWCLDGFDGEFYARSPERDPVSASTGVPTRVVRGAGYNIPAVNARSAFRFDDPPTGKVNTLGIRPARALEFGDSLPRGATTPVLDSAR